MKVTVYYQPTKDDSVADLVKTFKCDDWHQHFGCIHLIVNGRHRHIISLANVRHIEAKEE